MHSLVEWSKFQTAGPMAPFVDQNNEPNDGDGWTACQYSNIRNKTYTTLECSLTICLDKLNLKKKKKHFIIIIVITLRAHLFAWNWILKNSP